VWKKAGIVLAASAASLMAISPLAFAGDNGDRKRHGRDEGDSTQVNRVDSSRSSKGLINVDALNDANVCPSIASSDVTCKNGDNFDLSNKNKD